MQKRLSFVLAALVAGLFIYCGNAAMKQNGDGGGVSDAGAQACCTGGQTFTKLAEGRLDSTNMKVGPTPVGAYREIILYTNTTRTTQSTNCPLTARFRADGASFFGKTGPGDVNLVEGGRIRVDGADVELTFAYVPATCAGATIDYILAGVM